MRLPSAGPDVVFRVASFNFGIDQKMLGGTGQHQLNKPKESTTRKHIAKFAYLCDHIVQLGDAHILFGCEVGGKEEGFRAVGVSMSDLLRQPFGDGVIVRITSITCLYVGSALSMCVLKSSRRLAWSTGSG